MKIKLKKGYALSIAIVFAVVVMTTTIGLYAGIRYSTAEIRTGEVEHMRGYYAGVSGIRYAMILLENPVANGVFNTEAHDGEVFVLPDDLPNNPFIQFQPFDHLRITIEEWQTGETGWNNGNYNITIVYTP